MLIQMKKLDDRAVIPAQATGGSAGFDLCALLDAPLEIPPHGRALIPTGLAAAIPAGMAGLIFARSGLASKRGLGLANGVGLIDSDYRGELKVALLNSSSEPQTVEPGERVAQLVIMPVPAVELEEVAELDETDRGAGGFGSTGTR